VAGKGGVAVREAARLGYVPLGERERNVQSGNHKFVAECWDFLPWHHLSNIIGLPSRQSAPKYLLLLRYHTCFSTRPCVLSVLGKSLSWCSITSLHGIFVLKCCIIPTENRLYTNTDLRSMRVEFHIAFKHLISKPQWSPLYWHRWQCFFFPRKMTVNPLAFLFQNTIFLCGFWNLERMLSFVVLQPRNRWEHHAFYVCLPNNKPLMKRSLLSLFCDIIFCWDSLLCRWTRCWEMQPGYIDFRISVSRWIIHVVLSRANLVLQEGFN